jgi:hypothetical protein
VRIDWQGYIDQRLSASEMEEAERILASDERARQRVENMRRFRAHVREAVMQEQIPYDRLHRLMDKVVGKPAPRKSFRLGFLVVAVAAMAVLAFFLWPKALGEDVISTTSPSEAATWINDQTDLGVKPLSVPGGKLVMAERGDDWGCFCIEIDGKLIHVMISKQDRPVSGLRPKSVNGRQFLVGPGVVWKKDNLTYYVHGGDEKTRWKVVNALA